MKFPWVSRYRLEDAERRLDATDAERLRLLDLLLGADRTREVQARAVERVEAEDAQADGKDVEGQGEPVSFSTPFDRALNRFDQAKKNGAIPVKFRARIN